MEFPLKESLGAIVTLLVAWLGYSQWRRTKRSGRFVEDREAAYKAVWQALEDAHLYTRRGDFEDSTFAAHLTTAREVLLRNSLHIEDSHRASADTYLRALRDFGRLVGSLESAHPDKQEITTTGDYVTPPTRALAAFQTYTTARERVLSDFRKAIGAGQV